MSVTYEGLERQLKNLSYPTYRIYTSLGFLSRGSLLRQDSRVLATEVIEKTSFGHISEAQIALLAYLLENQGCFVNYERLIEYLMDQGVLSRSMKFETARIQTQKVLRVLMQKLGEYTQRKGIPAELESLKIERLRGKGVRLVIHEEEQVPLTYPMHGERPNGSLNEVLERLTLVEIELENLAQKIDTVLDILNGLKITLKGKDDEEKKSD